MIIKFFTVYHEEMKSFQTNWKLTKYEELKCFKIKKSSTRVINNVIKKKLMDEIQTCLNDKNFFKGIIDTNIYDCIEIVFKRGDEVFELSFYRNKKGWEKGSIQSIDFYIKQNLYGNILFLQNSN